MTFKHVKFEDSPTMRALEKVAKEKGLVKPEPLQKKASVTKKADYTPSNDFMENIFKLCAGLRANGLEKAAAEVETNYLRLKQAQTLYETSKEKGEDLVQSAHPKGSHKLEGVEGEEATVEDILDQHKKLVEVTNKKPTGKLSNASQIIKEVKKALAQAQRSEQEVIQEKNAILDKIPLKFGRCVALARDLGTSTWATLDVSKLNTLASAVTNILGVRPFKRPQYITLVGAYEKFANWVLDTGAFEHSVWHSDEHNKQSAALRGQILPAFNDCTNMISSLNNLLTEEANIANLREQGEYKDPNAPAKTLQIGEVTIQEGPLGPIYRQINSLKVQLQTWKTYGSIEANAGATKWIDEEIAELDKIMARMDKVPENDASEKEAAPNFQHEVDQEKISINQFKSGWVDKK